MKRIALAAFLTAVLAGPALAGSCPLLVKDIDAALAKGTSLPATQLAMVKELRDQGEAQHKSGSHGASLATLKKAKGILGI